MKLPPERQEAILRRLVERGAVDADTMSCVRAVARRERTQPLDLLIGRGHVSEGTVRAMLRLEGSQAEWERRALGSIALGAACILGLGLAVYFALAVRRDRTRVQVVQAPKPPAPAVPTAPANPVAVRPVEPRREDPAAARAAEEERRRRTEEAERTQRARVERATEQAQAIVARLAGTDRADVAAARAALRSLLDDSALPLDVRDRAQEQARTALAARRAALLERWRGDPRRAPFDAMAERKRELDARRQAALALIYDSAVYTYDHAKGDHGGRAQPDVDRLVAAVRESWKKRDENPLALDPALSDVLDELLEADRAVVEEGGATAIDAAECAQALEAVAAPVPLGEFSTDPREREILAWNRRVRDFNSAWRGDMRAEELKTIDLTNDYRAMMGRPILEANAALGVAARAHSSWMAAHQRLSHEEDDPERQHLGQRTTLAGYDGPNTGENIAFGPPDPAAAFHCWYVSSEHHRNLLDEGYNQIGIGKVRLYWTQDLGRGRPESGE